MILTYLYEKYQLHEGYNFLKINRDNFKYEVRRTISVDCGDFPSIENIWHDQRYYSVKHGLVTAKVGYCWDGPSGPTKDDKTNIRASLFHDIGYQTFKEASQLKKLSFIQKFLLRRAFDKAFRKILKADGMSFFRRTYYYLGVRGFGALFYYF